MKNELTIKSDIDTSVWETMRSQVDVLVKSGFLPKAVDTPEKALAIALKGRELGLPLMQSITSIHVIDGKPTISAELMAALVYQRCPLAILRCVETSNKVATYEAGRPGDQILRMSFTWDEATRAGITGKDNWRKYPAAMLRARCCSAICRIVFPDAIMGVYTPDELGAITTEEGEPVEGKIINITPPIAQPQRKSEAQQPAQQEDNPFDDGSPDNLTVKDVALTTGKKKDGKEWTKYHITTSDSKIWSTFSGTLGSRAQEAMKTGATVSVMGEEGQYGWELKELSIATHEAGTTTEEWTKEKIIDILTSSDNLDTLKANWASLIPHIGKLDGAGKGACQHAYDETERFIKAEQV